MTLACFPLVAKPATSGPRRPQINSRFGVEWALPQFVWLHESSGRMSGYSASEMMVAAARQLRDGEVVFVGIGLPFLATILAERTHAPRVVLLCESGVVDGDHACLPGSGGACEIAAHEPPRRQDRQGAPRQGPWWRSWRLGGYPFRRNWLKFGVRFSVNPRIPSSDSSLPQT